MIDASKTREDILSFLNERKIHYEFFEHPKAHSIDDCLKLPFITDDVTICKNIFLCNRQQTSFYLLLLKPHTPFRTAIVSKALGVSRLSFAPEEALEEKLHLSSGSVSVLGLYFDRAHSIGCVAENAVLETPRIAFHPCDNSATVIFSQEDFWQQLLPAMGVSPVFLKLGENPLEGSA